MDLNGSFSRNENLVHVSHLSSQYMTGQEGIKCTHSLHLLNVNTGNIYIPSFDPILSVLAIMCPVEEPNNHVLMLNPQTEYSWGEEAFYQCEPGYVMRGQPTRRCISHHQIPRLSGINPLCKGKICTACACRCSMLHNRISTYCSQCRKNILDFGGSKFLQICNDSHSFVFLKWFDVIRQWRH